MLNNSRIDFQGFFTEYMTGLKTIMDALPPAEIQTAISYLAEAYEEGRRIFIIGNGGSAATASHIACDLGKTVLGGEINSRRKRFAVFALTDNVASITAWANDVSYDMIFAEQLKNFAHPSDLLIVISGSGNSPNVVEAVRVAREMGLKSIGFLGFDGGVVKQQLDHALIVASNNYGQIEDAHMILSHFITAYFKEVLKPVAEIYPFRPVENLVELE